MNSVTRHLSASSKAATLLTMRSAKKQILLVVEGDTDVDLYANAFGIDRSNLLSCGGKGVLMALYALSPRKGIDEGTLFFRDRDHDNEVTRETNEVLLLVTDRYDIEMELLEKRLFCRMFIDFSANRASISEASHAFSAICSVAAQVSALRYYSEKECVGLGFDDLKYNKFLRLADFHVDISAMVKYVYAKSKKTLMNPKEIENAVRRILSGNQLINLSCSKEFIDIMHIFIDRVYDYCASAECCPPVLSRMIRVAANIDDIRNLHYFETLKQKIVGNKFSWNGTGF